MLFNRGLFLTAAAAACNEYWADCLMTIAAGRVRSTIAAAAAYNLDWVHCATVPRPLLSVEASVLSQEVLQKG